MLQKYYPYLMRSNNIIKLPSINVPIIWISAFCSPGYFSPSGLAPCHKCPRGSFQSNFGQKSCFQCPFDMTSLYAGAKSAMECSSKYVEYLIFKNIKWIFLEGCEAGNFLFGKKCMPCPRGFFQQNPNEKFCQRCPTGTTTLEEGAKSFLHCTGKVFFG